MIDTKVKQKMVLSGNHAVSYGALLSRVQVIAAYPITPQTQVVELLSEMVADGVLRARFVTVESEHSAMAACIGASAVGARAFTATSSHGLALMHEMLHWAAGARLPIVMANINRALAPPWSIWTDQNDSIAQRDTGWMQIYCESNQEVLDSVILAYKVSEKVLLPTMLILDAFVLSHTEEPVEVPSQEEVDSFLPPYNNKDTLKPGEARAYGALAMPDTYMEFRYKMQKAMEEALEEIEKQGEEFHRIFGRRYGLIEEFMTDDAEIVLVTVGATTSTARFVVKSMREEGKKVGLLKLRVVRPFPFEVLRKALLGKKKVAVVDRNISFGYHGAFFQEIKSALYGFPDAPKIFGYIAGLGGRDITPDLLKEIVEDVEEREEAPEIIWKGVRE
jgi:pyruvate/2-oxoacid:ferredoxin oxidoreductase alpha subunit